MTDLASTAAGLRSSVARLARRLRAEAGQEDYTEPQIAVLRQLLNDGPATTSELARSEGVRPQSMSATVASLEASGILARRPDPVDGRAQQVYVTEAGLRAIEQGRAAKQGWLVSAMEQRLTPAEQERLADAAALIDRLLAP